MPNDLEDRSHNDNSSQPSEFWPPKPEASSATAAATSQPGDFRAFPAINGWIIFFLQYFTFGFYSPFWIARTARILNKLTIPEALPLSYVWGLVIALIVAVTTFFVSLFMEHIHDPRLQAVEMISKIFQFGFAVYYWVIVFRLRNALNFIVSSTSPNLGEFGSVGTFFFGPLYFQIKINALIKARNKQLGLGV